MKREHYGKRRCDREKKEQGDVDFLLRLQEEGRISGLRYAWAPPHRPATTVNSKICLYIRLGQQKVGGSVDCY